MKIINAIAVAVLSGLMLAGCGKECHESPSSEKGASAVSSGSPRTVKPAFERIARELDYGGDYFEVIDAASFRSDIVEMVDLVASCVDEFAPYAPRVVKAADRLGLLALRGRGESVKEVGPSVYEHKSFVLLDPVSVPLADLVTAGEATMPVVETYLPDTSVVAVSFSMDVQSLLAAAAECVDLFVPGEGSMALLQLKTKVPVVDSVGLGTTVAVTLDESRTWTVPELSMQAAMPSPGVLAAQSVKDDLPWTMLTGALGLESREHPQYAGVRVCSVPLPTEKLRAFRIEPVLAYDADRKVILAASSPDVLERALAASRGGRGRMVDDPAFVAAVGKLEAHNALCYVSPKLVPAVAKVVREGMPPSTMRRLPYGLRKLLDNPPAFWFATQLMRRQDGIATSGRASYGACSVLRLVGECCSLSSVGTAGVLTGALVPSVTSSLRRL